MLKQLKKKLSDYQCTGTTTTITIMDDIVYNMTNPPIMISPNLDSCAIRKENDMAYEQDNLEINQRNFAKDRIRDIAYRQRDTAYTTYKLTEPEGPRTKDELLAALKAGNFSIDEDYVRKDGTIRGTATYAISWRTADNQPDKEGYEKAVKQIEADAKSLKDIAILAPIADVLKAIQDFEARTY